VRIGASGGEVFQAVEDCRDDRLYDFAVNPGHSIHLDEWVHSAFEAGSQVLLRSGMALQMDIIPVSKGPFWYVNAEDGIVLADEQLQSEIADSYPECWQRMQARREFMRSVLGIRIDQTVLPMSNAPAVFAPYLLRPDYVCVQTS
jgi:hypothetical protein